MRNFDDINVFWVVEEPGMVIYETNDAEGKYFPDRFYADTCINGNYEADYFIKESSAYEWLSKLTDGKVKSEEDVDKFNYTCSENDFICVHEFKVVT